MNRSSRKIHHKPRRKARARGHRKIHHKPRRKVHRKNQRKAEGTRITRLRRQAVTVEPGPYADERKSLFLRIQAASDRGIGTQSYKWAFLDLEGLVPPK